MVQAFRDKLTIERQNTLAAAAAVAAAAAAVSDGRAAAAADQPPPMYPGRLDMPPAYSAAVTGGPSGSGDDNDGDKPPPTYDEAMKIVGDEDGAETPRAESSTSAQATSTAAVTTVSVVNDANSSSVGNVPGPQNV